MAALGDKHMLLNSEGEADIDNITIKPQAPTELFKIIKEDRCLSGHLMKSRSAMCTKVF